MIVWGGEEIPNKNGGPATARVERAGNAIGKAAVVNVRDFGESLRPLTSTVPRLQLRSCELREAYVTSALRAAHAETHTCDAW